MRLILAIAAIVVCSALAAAYFLASSPAPMLESSSPLPSAAPGGDSYARPPAEVPTKEAGEIRGSDGGSPSPGGAVSTGSSPTTEAELPPDQVAEAVEPSQPSPTLPDIFDVPSGGGGGSGGSGSGGYSEEQSAPDEETPGPNGSDSIIASGPPPETEPPGTGTDDESVLAGNPREIEPGSGVAPETPAPATEVPALPGSDAEDLEKAQAEHLEEMKRFEEQLARLREQQMEEAGAREEAIILPSDVSPAPPAPVLQEETVDRYPTLDAPEEAVAGAEITVTVALTEEQLTPDVTIKPGPTSTLTDDGALALSLPAETDEWSIDIDLLAAGFDLADGGKWSRRITLFREGDSDFARFALKARAIRDPSKQRQLIARLYHAGEFLGSVSRPITVLREPPLQADAPPDGGGAAAASAPVTLAALPPAHDVLSTKIGVGGEAADVPDLDVTIHYSDPDQLGDGLIIIHSPHIGAPVSAEFTTPAGMNEWLNSEYLRLVDLGLKLRGAVPLSAGATAQDPQTQTRFIAKVAEGFGLDLYRGYVPEAFKQVFWSLKREDKLRSIQITSNSPVMPWELVVPQDADGKPDGFLGISYRLARWAPRSEAGQVDRPLDRLAFTGVAAVAPAYDGNLELPFQKVEVDALSRLDGFRLVDGDFGSFERMLGEVSTGFIHFSGHGEVNDPGTGSPVFAIRLLDQALDPTTWRALTFAPHDKGNPFFFFNACDTGRARSLGGFVQGWGPAVLASGASGFIGGMWPLSDRTAADFSTDFYGGIAGHLQDGPVYVAEVLQEVRKAFFETGDPTYLAYTFYGNANLQVVRE